MDEVDFLDVELKDFLQQLLDEGHISDDAPRDIIRKIIADEGIDDLSEKQMWRYVRDILPYLRESTCEQCGTPLSWEEKGDALFRGAYCSYCHYKREEVAQLI
ncbi:MAG: hypothetical protein Q8P93_00090 [bacterium]|nr:hypothetical protein [bacterium]